MTSPPRGGFYSSDVQLCGPNLCIWPSEQALVRMLRARKANCAKCPRPHAFQTLSTAAEEVLCHDSESFYLPGGETGRPRNLKSRVPKGTYRFDSGPGTMTGVRHPRCSRISVAPFDFAQGQLRAVLAFG